jgi:polyisoprenoid-binding protein YceI
MNTNTIEEIAVSTWSVDPTHSSIHFKVRHMAIAWVRGEFRITKGSLRLNDDDMSDSRMEIEIDAASVNSGDPQRDQHLRNADFLDVERFPSIHFRSTQVVSRAGGAWEVLGELTIHGVSRPVGLKVSEVSARVRDPWGNTRIAAAASARVSRKEFGLTWNQVLETGGLLVGDEIFIDLDVEFVKAAE